MRWRAGAWRVGGQDGLSAHTKNIASGRPLRAAHLRVSKLAQVHRTLALQTVSDSSSTASEDRQLACGTALLERTALARVLPSGGKQDRNRGTKLPARLRVRRRSANLASEILFGKRRSPKDRCNNDLPCFFCFSGRECGLPDGVPLRPRCFFKFEPRARSLPTQEHRSRVRPDRC